MNQRVRTSERGAWRALLSLSLLASLAASGRAEITNGGFESTPNHLQGWSTGGAVTAVDLNEGAIRWVAQIGSNGVLSQVGWQCGDAPDPKGTCVVTFNARIVGGPAGKTPLLVNFGNVGAPNDAISVLSVKSTEGWHAYEISSKECTFKYVSFFGRANEMTADTKIYIDNVTSKCVPVPEPATMAALGLGALGLLKRRKRA